MTRTADPTQTPMMRQYLSFKKKHPDALLFFRMGDFYEMFFEDAEVGARELDLNLTTRDRNRPNPIPMAGVPVHAADGYIAKLVGKGFRVAVCEQVGDPAKAKGLVDRDVVEVVTPGTAVHASLVPETSNNYVGALAPGDGTVGVALADVTTGEFLVEDLPAERWAQTLESLPVSEWVTSDSEPVPELPGRAAGSVRRPARWFDADRGRRGLQARYGETRLAALPGEPLHAAAAAAGALLEYLREVRGEELGHFVRIGRITEQDYLVLDETTCRNLEITAPLLGTDTRATLLAVLDRTGTALGARRLRRWVDRPLVDRAAIEARHEALGELVDRPTEGETLTGVLSRFRDLERLLGRCAVGKAGPREVLTLGAGCVLAPELAAALEPLSAPWWRGLAGRLPGVEPLGRRLLEALVDEPPVAPGDGGVFREGWDEDLDTLRERARGGKAWIASLQESERRKTGIATLKVGYNKVFGYYLEVTAAHQAKVPEHYIRKQTLVNAERYVTPELKEEEERILRAADELKLREVSLFQELRATVVEHADAIQQLADIVADADALRGLAELARIRRYVRPVMSDDPVLDVREGRHPVVETLLPAGEFVPNDLALDAHTRQLAIITGPNMAGKSTYLRQAGLITIMAQIGSFVPAAEAVVGIVDRVFTRVGASDSIARGQSTFMVEMEETGTILHQATDRSLVLLDEVGRGTSTYDGLSIAWAVTEHLHERRRGRPRTLFATHYHELTALAGSLPRVFNLVVQVKEWNGKVIFLRTIAEGAADRSYGIHVAELAGLPPEVVTRAHQILDRLENHRMGREDGGEAQLTLFEPVAHGLIEELRDIDPDAMTPMQALEWLQAMRRKYRS